MKKLIILSLLLFFSFINQPVWAEILPRSTGADSRVKIIHYDPNNIVLLKGKYGYQTDIRFAPNETIQNVSLGDSLAWQAVPVANHLFIKPMTASQTNMTVLTSVNSYNFQLDSRDANTNPTYTLQFIYPAGGYDQGGIPNAVATFNPDQLNWKYSFTGDKSLAPLRALDNGQFTYFTFKKSSMKHLPAIFTVDKNRQETLVNYHLQGDTLVINTIAKQFTLRDGAAVTSIYNDALIGDWDSIK